MAEGLLSLALRKSATPHAIDLALAAARELFDQGLPSPPTTPKAASSDPWINLMPVASFMKHVAKRARCTVGTMLVSYVYIKRLRARLGSVAGPSNSPCAYHRIVFTAMMIAHKLWNDCTMVGKHWAKVSSMFTSKEILRMERDFLRLLNYDINLSLSEVVFHAPTFLEASLHRLVDHARIEYPNLNDEKPFFSVKAYPSFISPPPSPQDLYQRSAIKRRRSSTDI